MTEPCGQPVLSQQRQFGSDKPSPSYVCLILGLPKQLIRLHSVSLSAVLSGRGSARHVCALPTLSACVCAHAIKTECMHVFICVCASMRGSLKRSFIQKYTVQGEMSDELFRDISHRRKRVFLEVRPLKGCVCAGSVYVCACKKARGRERERYWEVEREWVGVLQGSEVSEVGHISNQPNRLCQYEATTADVEQVIIYRNFPSGNLENFIV